MAVYEGGTFGPGWQGQDGDIYINATIYASSSFGERTLFVNPTFQRCCAPYYNNPPSQVGKGSIVEGGYWDKVTFAQDTILKSGGGGEYTNNGRQDPKGKAAGRTEKYDEKNHGVIVTTEEVMDLLRDKRWDCEVLNKGYLIVGNNNGVTVNVPKITIVCEQGEQTATGG